MKAAQYAALTNSTIYGSLKIIFCLTRTFEKLICVMLSTIRALLMSS